MGRRCTVCDHQNVGEIDKLLLSGEIFRTIASNFGLTESALKRHRKSHLIGQLAEVQQAKEEALRRLGEQAFAEANLSVCQAKNLLDQIHDLRLKALSLLDQAESSGDLRTALAGIKEARGCIELLAKIDGQMDERTQVNITLSTEWVELRALIINALEPYPEARQAVTNALH